MHGYYRLSGFGAMDPAAAAAQITESKVTASGKAAILASAGAGQMLDDAGQPAYIPGSADCSAVNGSGMLKPAITGVAGGLVLKFAGLAGPAAPAVMAVGALLEVFSAIFAHHAAAVQKEQSTLCAAVPAANQALQIIAEAVSSGQATPQDAINALQAMPGQFRSQVSGIYQDCNAACVMYEELEAICLVQASQYQDIINAASAAAAAPPPPPVVLPQVAPPPVPTATVTAVRPNTTQPIVAVPPSSYTSFYSPSPTPPSAPNTVAAPTGSVPAFTTAPVPAAVTSTTDWLPIAAVVVAGFFLMRSL
jgi:hypothetical protein